MTLLESLVKENKLPTVNVEAAVSKKTLVDFAATAIIIGVVILLVNKLILSKI